MTTTATSVMCRQTEPAICVNQAAMRCIQNVRAPSKSGGGQIRPKFRAQAW